MKHVFRRKIEANIGQIRLSAIRRMTMKKLICYKRFVSLMIILVLVTGCDNIQLSNENPVEGWAVLAEKDDYTGLYMEDLSVNYIDNTRMRQTLENSGWNPAHIHELREFDRETLQAELDWLEENADKNDIVILYVTAHSDYLSGIVRWREFFSAEWEQISSRKRLLVIDSCRAADFTGATFNDSNPHLSVAAVEGNELSWKGIEEEGLPIIGGVFTYYLTEALGDPDSDTNGDGLVSVQEAVQITEEQQRIYFQEMVFVVPEFLDYFHETFSYPERDPTYPHVKVDDSLGEPLFLTLDAYLQP